MLRRIFLAWAASISLASADEPTFYVGGGVGAVSCPEFLNVMATARQQGRLGTVQGVQLVQGFEMYVAGFETGYNMQSPPSARGILGSLTEPTSRNALYAIEPWCASHPESNFGNAVVALARTLER